MLSWDVKSKVKRGLTLADLYHHIKQPATEREKQKPNYQRVNMQVIPYMTYQSGTRGRADINKFAQLMDRYTACLEKYTDVKTYETETSRLANELEALQFNVKDLALYQSINHVFETFDNLKPSLDYAPKLTQKEFANIVLEYQQKYIKDNGKKFLTAMNQRIQADNPKGKKKRVFCRHCGLNNHWDKNSYFKKESGQSGPEIKSSQNTSSGLKTKLCHFGTATFNSSGESE